MPDYISAAYDGVVMQYGPEYIIPKPFDRRVLIWEAAAVAQAAIDEGIAGVPAEDFNIDRYREELEARLGESYSVMRQMINQVKGKGKRIVFSQKATRKPFFERRLSWWTKTSATPSCSGRWNASTRWWRIWD